MLESMETVTIVPNSKYFTPKAQKFLNPTLPKQPIPRKELPKKIIPINSSKTFYSKQGLSTITSTEIIRVGPEDLGKNSNKKSIITIQSWN